MKKDNKLILYSFSIVLVILSNGLIGRSMIGFKFWYYIYPYMFIVLIVSLLLLHSVYKVSIKREYEYINKYQVYMLLCTAFNLWNITFTMTMFIDSYANFTLVQSQYRVLLLVFFAVNLLTFFCSHYVILSLSKVKNLNNTSCITLGLTKTDIPFILKNWFISLMNYSLLLTIMFVLYRLFSFGPY